MAQDEIDRLYQQFLHEGEQKGEVDPGAGGEANRRRQPRLKVEATQLTIRAELKVSATDVSLSGLAFLSNFPVQLGQPLFVTVGDLFTVDAEVVTCKLLEADEAFENTVYRVQCKFPEEEQGRYLVVAVKELDRQRREKEAAAEGDKPSGKAKKK